MFPSDLRRRLPRVFWRKPKLVGFGVLATLILGLGIAAVVSGFRTGFWPNLFLNAAGDMLGGMVILLMIEPIVSRAAVQIRQLPHLDFRLFSRRIGQSEREIRVLDTYSGLFDSAHGPRSLPALQQAVLRGVHVKVLLMSPATDVSRLRQAQLETSYPGLSIDAQIHNNISALGLMEYQLSRTLRDLVGLTVPPHTLGNKGSLQAVAYEANEDAGGEDGETPTTQLAFSAAPEESGVYSAPPAVREPSSGDQDILAARQLRPEGVGSFELRLYSAAAPFTLYQRDDTLLYALQPAYQFAHDAPQLEVNAGSLTGMQILEKFDELWEDARPVRRLAPIRASDQDGAEPMWVRYLEIGDKTYYISSRIDAALKARPDQHFWLGERDGVECEAEAVPVDSTLHKQLLDAHGRKYSGERRRAPNFYQMWPTGAQLVPRGRTLDFDRLPTEQILQRLGGAERTVRILDTSSSLIGQDGDESGAEAFVRAAMSAMSRGATVRIMLLAPTTSAARARAKEIRDQHFDRMVERNIQRLRYLAAQLPTHGIEPERLQVRLYDELPEISVHQTDDRVLVGFLPYRRRSSLASQLETERQAALGIFAVGQFDRMWERARPLSGLRYVILRVPTAAQGERLLVRAWLVGRTWFLASARVEELLAAEGPAAHGVRAWIEEAPGVEFRLSEPLERERNMPVWNTFARIYSYADPGVAVRALQTQGERPER